MCTYHSPSFPLSFYSEQPKVQWQGLSSCLFISWGRRRTKRTSQSRSSRLADTEGCRSQSGGEWSNCQVSTNARGQIFTRGDNRPNCLPMPCGRLRDTVTAIMKDYRMTKIQLLLTENTKLQYIMSCSMVSVTAISCAAKSSCHRPLKARDLATIVIQVPQ